MNTKQILIGVAVIVLLGGGAYALSMHTSGPVSREEMNGPTSLQALIALGVPKTCTFTDGSGDTQVAGTVYVAGGKSRGDIETTAGGKVMHAHSIVKDDFMYSWIDENGMGVKIAVPKDKPEAPQNNQQFDAQKQIDYHCSTWIPDNSKFETPATITFSEVALPTGAGASAGASAGTAPAGSGSACTQACQSVPEAYRAQCLAAC